MKRPLSMHTARALAALALAGTASLAGLGLAPAHAPAMTVDEAAALLASPEVGDSGAPAASDIELSVSGGDVVVSETLPEGVPADDLAVARRAAAAASELSSRVVTRVAKAPDGSVAHSSAARAATVTWQQRSADGALASSVSFTPGDLPDASAGDVASMVASASAYALSDGSARGPVIERVEYLTGDDHVFSSYDLLMDYMEQQYLAGNRIGFQTCEVFRDDGLAGDVVLPNGYRVAPGTGVVTKPDGTQIFPDEPSVQRDRPVADPGTSQPQQDEGLGQPPKQEGQDRPPTDPQPPAGQDVQPPLETEPVPDPTPAPEPVPDPKPQPVPEPAPEPIPEPEPEPKPQPVWVWDYTEYLTSDGASFADFDALQDYMEQQYLAGNPISYEAAERGHWE